MDCENCQAEADTLVERAGVYVCAACCPEYDRLKVGNSQVPELLASIDEKLRILLYERGGIDVNVVNTVEVTGSVTAYDSR